jgi:hypothetical protein
LAKLQVAQEITKESAAFEWGQLTAESTEAIDLDAVKAYVEKWDRHSLSLDWTLTPPQVGAAKAMLAPKPEPTAPANAEPPKADDAQANATDPAPKKAPPAKGSTPAKAAAPVSDSSDCTENSTLENFAMMGALGELRIQCVEDRITNSPRQTERDKLSRILLYDAEIRKASDEWADLMKRHLEDIDRSDPDLCFKYAIYLSRNNADEGHEIIRWINYSLENRDKWKATLYVQRNDALQRLRAQTAYKMWRDTSDRLVASGGANVEIERDAEKFRGWTKEYAREWLLYAQSAGRDTTKAMQICSSAAGTSTYCTEE